MNNPKVRSLGRRGGQKTSGENEEVKKKGSYSYQVDDETKDIVKSLFEEYASDDGKNFYSGNRDEKAEKEHEEFINEVDKQLDVYSPEEEEDISREKAAVSPLKSKMASEKAEADKQEGDSEQNKDEKPEAKASEAEAETAAAEEPVPEEPDSKSTKVREKRVSLFRSPKTAEPSEEASEDEKKSEEAKEAKPDKKTKTKTKKRKAADKMKKKTNSKNEEIYDEYEDGYDEYDSYEDAYDDEDYEDEYDDEDEYEDEYDEPKRSGSGVEFSLKIVSLTIVLVIVLLIMTALFINNRSLSRELQEKTDQYDELVVQYTQDVDQLNAALDAYRNPQSETEDTSAVSSDENTAGEASESDSDSESGEENYYVVQAGDTLSKIAASELGSSSLYYLIQEANNMGSTTSLSVGDKLIIPDVE